MKTTTLFWVMLFSIAVAACGGAGGAGGSPTPGGSTAAAISAIATAYTEKLGTGTAITSFSPLTVSGGVTPYTYSYTGTLASGLSFSTSTGVISGTPTQANLTVDSIVVSVKDANNVAAKTTSTVTVETVNTVYIFANCSTAC